MIPPAEAFRAPVDNAPRLLLVLLWTYASHADPHAFVWPSIATLAEQLGVDERAIYKRLAELRRAGLIRRCRQARRWSGGMHTVLGWVLRDAPDDAIAYDDNAIGYVVCPADEAESDPALVDTLPPATVPAAGSDPLAPTHNPTLPAETVSTSIGSGTDHAPQQAPATAEATPRERDLLVEGVLDAMRTACCQLHNRGGCGPDDCEGNRALIRKCSKAVRVRGQTDEQLLEDWRRVITRQLANVRTDRSKWRFLSLSTLCVVKNFLRIRDTPEGRARSQRFAPSSWDDDDVPPPE